MEFIAANIEHQKWQHREAAVMAFGSILEGPSPENLKQVINQVIEYSYLVFMLEDPPLKSPYLGRTTKYQDKYFFLKFFASLWYFSEVNSVVKVYPFRYRGRI